MLPPLPRREIFFSLWMLLLILSELFVAEASSNVHGSALSFSPPTMSTSSISLPVNAQAQGPKTAPAPPRDWELDLTFPPPEKEEPVPYVHRWTMDFFLLGFVLAAGGWIAMLMWVQKDVDDRRAEPKQWNAIVLLLPGVGFLFYLIARWWQMRHIIKSEALSDQKDMGETIVREKRKLGLLYGGRTRLNQPASAKKQRVTFEFLDVDRNPIQIKRDSPEMTGIELATEVLQEAMTERSSDVHVEPREKDYRVRFRVDGVLQERMFLEKSDGLHLISSLKVLSQIDISEKRKAQDGRFRVRTGTNELDYRVATTSSIFGEKMVLRILDHKTGVLGLADVGMPAEMLEQFERIIHLRNGIILATGPTGSGKTSTLYAALMKLDRIRLNIMTIEDPVEYELEGVTQIPVNVKAGVTFESGLRSILRLDPDVIFVGEIRDSETAQIAIRSALTGHLVFSSLHALDAVGSVTRLVDMGVERFQISSTLLMVVAQRLVRVLCKECREAYPAATTELKELGMTLPEGKIIYRATGCEVCDHTGYQGRTGIFELLVLDQEMRSAINEGASQQTLFEIARRKGFRIYRQDGMDKIEKGITTVEEVLQAS